MELGQYGAEISLEIVELVIRCLLKVFVKEKIVVYVKFWHKLAK